MPTLPKPAATRQRNQRASSRSVLSSDHSIEAPKLPSGRAWHKMTRQWWRDIWSSPMAPEFLEADTHGLFSLAVLEDDFWTAESPRDRVVLMAEIRLQRQCYGLTPIDRRRLQWEIEKGESATDKTKRRRLAPKSPAPAEVFDPRLHLVS